MGRGGALAREISFVSLVAYGPKVSDSALAMGVTASETRQGGSQHQENVTFPVESFLTDLLLQSQRRGDLYKAYSIISP